MNAVAGSVQPLPKIGNFRDYGAISSDLGGQVRAGWLFRSGHVAHVRGENLARLLALDLGVICDLRYEGERADQPSCWPATYASRILMHDGNASADAPHVAVMKSGVFDEEGVRRFYIHYYRILTRDPLYSQLFGRFLSTVARQPGRSLIHCSVGKDRTGILAALVLHALGVGKDGIMADFVASNSAAGIDAMAPEVEKRLREKLGQPVSKGAVRKMLEVEEDYLQASFDTIREEWGSVDAFFDSIGFDSQSRERLREQLII